MSRNPYFCRKESGLSRNVLSFSKCLAIMEFLQLPTDFRKCMITLTPYDIYIFESLAIDLIEETVDAGKDLFAVDFFSWLRLLIVTIGLEEGEDAEVAVVVTLVRRTF
jgi:hypothetical protein